MTREEAIKNIKEHCYFASLLPQAKEALDVAIKVLEQEPCDDAISRQAVIDTCDQSINLFEAADRIKELPPVTPQPKTGHWIINEDEENTVHGHCSVCGWEAHYYEDDIIGMSYCPYCGAKMEEELQWFDIA